MKRIVTFGEIMLRLQAPSFKKLVQSDHFLAYYGGSEANTAVALSQFGESAAVLTKLPQNALGDACENELRKWGVDTSGIARGGERMGIYFTEKGASQRPPMILYDRAYSAFSGACADDFDFNQALTGADLFHFSGITPALGEGLVDLTKQAVKAAKAKGAVVSCDLNYRSKLWSAEKARDVMSELIHGIELLIINENQADEVFGVREENYEKTAQVLSEMFSINNVALTKRRTVSGEVNNFSAMIYADRVSFWSREYPIFMIDKIGGGDSFSAGLICALLSSKGPQFAVDFAAAAACYKHTIEGDFPAASREEIENLMKSDGNGRFVR